MNAEVVHGQLEGREQQKGFNNRATEGKRYLLSSALDPCGVVLTNCRGFFLLGSLGLGPVDQPSVPVWCGQMNRAQDSLEKGGPGSE